ncbi:hypothetical protein Micbo1qcDRAFT_162427 [Microdochium bolleyi]|uniref:Uncharacterized protein n=1 Tax=Microdochium bolleyi TaxID=196109 RepID=A0A136J5I9_9PEZI|nr:hypothetical protein Micbo1qcDRAFT_162427 [Microdochium bolleyi]
MNEVHLHPAIIVTVAVIPVLFILALVTSIVKGFNLRRAFRERTRSPDLESSLSSRSVNSITTTESNFIGQSNGKSDSRVTLPQPLRHAGGSPRVRFGPAVALPTQHRQKTPTGHR